MEQYKVEYNRLLERYYNGCSFLQKNPTEIDNYLDLLLNILDKLNIIINERDIVDSDIILNGFK